MTSASPTVSSTADLDFTGRRAPWSNDAEQAVLGAMLLDQDAALKAAELLDDSMFYKEAHRILFRAMASLTERSDVIDPVTLREELAQRGDLDRAGGMEYIAALVDVVPTAANIEHHTRIVRDKAVLRRLVEAATEIIQDVYEARGDSTEVLDNAEHRIFQVAQYRRSEEFLRLKELIWPTMERIEPRFATAKSRALFRLDEAAGVTPEAVRASTCLLYSRYETAIFLFGYFRVMTLARLPQ